jgi:protein involved in sex pheromone biosynthesis
MKKKIGIMFFAVLLLLTGCNNSTTQEDNQVDVGDAMSEVGFNVQRTEEVIQNALNTDPYAGEEFVYILQEAEIRGAIRAEFIDDDNQILEVECEDNRIYQVRLDKSWRTESYIVRHIMDMQTNTPVFYIDGSFSNGDVDSED